MTHVINTAFGPMSPEAALKAFLSPTEHKLDWGGQVGIFNQLLEGRGEEGRSAARYVVENPACYPKRFVNKAAQHLAGGSAFPATPTAVSSKLELAALLEHVASGDMLKLRMKPLNQGGTDARYIVGMKDTLVRFSKLAQALAPGGLYEPVFDLVALPGLCAPDGKTWFADRLWRAVATFQIIRP